MKGRTRQMNCMCIEIFLDQELDMFVFLCVNGSCCCGCFFVINYRKRFDFASYVRCLANNVWEDVEADDDEEQDMENSELMDVEKVHLRKPGRNFRNQVIRAL